MEFKSLKNIETSFKQIRIIAIVFVVLCAGITGYAVWSSFSFAEAQRLQKIYVLDEGKSLMLALSQDLSQNRPVEAREHIKRFLNCFLHCLPTKAPLNQTSTGHSFWWTKCFPLLSGYAGERLLQPHCVGEYQSDYSD